MNLKSGARLGLIVFLCADLACRTTPPSKKTERAGESLPNQPNLAGDDSLLQSIDEIKKIGSNLKKVYADFLKDPRSKNSPGMVNIARAIVGMEPSLLTDILMSRDDFKALQGDLAAVNRAKKNQAKSKSGATGDYVEGDIPWSEFEKIAAEVPDPYEKVEIVGLTMAAIGVGAVLASYFLKVTNKHFKEFEAMEKLRSQKEDLAIITGNRELEASPRLNAPRSAAAEFDPALPIKKVGDSELEKLGSTPEIGRSAGKQPDQPEAAVRARQAEIAAEGGYARERYEASTTLRKAGMISLLMAALALGTREATSTYYELTDGGKRDKDEAVNPAVAELMRKLANLELALNHLYEKSAQRG